MNGVLGVDLNGQPVTQGNDAGYVWSLILGAAQSGSATGVLGVDENGGVVTQQSDKGKIMSLILGALQ